MKKLLLENDFYLPNLSSSLDYDKWGYCHEVARYCNGKDDLTKAFIDVLKKISKEESSSKSALEKVHALIIYNFSTAIRSEFEEFLKSIGFNDFEK